MSSNIIFNRKNLTNEGKGNNKLTYNLPRDVKFIEGDTIAISHLNIYFSWFNITSKNNNNKFFYKWWDMNGELNDVFEVSIPDGFYSVNTLYEFLLTLLVSRGHYLKLLTGNFLHFIEILSNETYYSISFRLNSVSDYMDLGNGLKPTTDLCQAPTTWALPTTFQTPEVIIPSTNKFGELLGFSSGSLYKDLSVNPATTNQKYTFSNDLVPNLLPASSYIITCNLVDNEMSIPNNVLYSFTIPNNTGFGDLINPNNDVIFAKIKPGQYREINLCIFDQDFNPLQILDSNMLIVLSVIKKIE